MSARLGPIKRSEFIARLRALGFHFASPGTNHAIMVFGRKRLAIPSDREYSVALQLRMLREISLILEATITRDAWTKLHGARPRSAGD